MSKYEVGQQPCQNFKPHRDGNGYAEWDNAHECIFCAVAYENVTVSFCETCCKDHHANGYETCKRTQKRRDGQ